MFGASGMGRPTPNTTPGADSALAVTFYTHLDSGRPHIRIEFPGDRTKEVDRRARDADKERFPAQWAAFESDQSQVVGTPIESWPLIDARTAKELQAKAIYSVELLAGTTDGNINQLGLGARVLRGKAISWLEARKAPTPTVAQVQAENQELRARLDALTRGKA